MRCGGGFAPLTQDVKLLPDQKEDEEANHDDEPCNHPHVAATRHVVNVDDLALAVPVHAVQRAQQRHPYHQVDPGAAQLAQCSWLIGDARE